MSTFSVPIIRIEALEPIPGADAIELAVVGGYRSVVQKGLHTVGNLAVYIPEQSVLPDNLIETMGLTGRLAGANKNRVKAIRLRGCLSQGLLYPVTALNNGFDGYAVQLPTTMFRVTEGEDVADRLGIVKYEVAVPAAMAGEVYAAGQHLTVPYDIENLKWHMDVIAEGEEVVMTEKLHGTFTGIGILPRGDWDDKHFLGRFVVFSKGLGAKGLAFKDVEANASNLYVRTLMEEQIFGKLQSMMEMIEGEGGGFDVPLFFLGEIFGQGVQDLAYGMTTPSFRLFDVVTGYRGDQRFFDHGERLRLAKLLGIATVPELYVGPFSHEAVSKVTNGKDTLSGSHVREGVVITPTVNRYEPSLGRVILKSVSEAYLLRKNKDGSEPTEYN